MSQHIQEAIVPHRKRRPLYEAMLSAIVVLSIVMGTLNIVL